MSNFESSEPCIVCGFYAEKMVCYHHILRRKSFMQYSRSNWNMIPVCLQHHNEFHNKSTREMATKYKRVNDWLLMHGWTFDVFFNEWCKPDDT
jgi:hypothetical protein